jgi:hypothetical protein
MPRPHDWGVLFSPYVGGVVAHALVGGVRVKKSNNRNYTPVELLVAFPVFVLYLICAIEIVQTSVFPLLLTVAPFCIATLGRPERVDEGFSKGGKLHT